MRHHVENFVEFVRKLIAYIPVLWRDRDWDYAYIYILLEFKLQRMEKCLLNGHHEIDNYKQLGRAIELLGRLKDDAYYFTTPLYLEHEKKWGKLIWLKDDHPLDVKLVRENVKTREDWKQWSIESMEMHKELDDQKKQNKAEFFKLLHDNIERWWD